MKIVKVSALGTPPVVAAIVEHELAAECVDEDPLFSERIYGKMYNGSRSRPALERGVTQADESRRRGVIMEAIAGIDIVVWDVKAQSARHSALPSAWRGAQFGAGLCERRLGTGRRDRGGTRGLRRERLHRREDARRGP